MRKIEKEMIEAIEDGKNWSKDNTRVWHDRDNHAGVYLFNNLIAYETSQGWLVQNCGWESSTTSSRLNALSTIVGSDLWTGVRIHKGRMYLTYRHRADELMNGAHPV